MKIFYGVQATGNGHITRARILGKALEAKGAEITWLFTGRAPEKLFDMDAFGNYRTCKGLTFATRKEHIDLLQTAMKLSFPAFFRDVTGLDLAGYDRVISDFEPVTAWSCKFQGLPCLGISHQNAFKYPIPVEGDRPLPRLVMNLFAPCTLSVGLHWHPFAPPILPPIIDTSHTEKSEETDKILVYLPFEDHRTVQRVLRDMQRGRFMIYCDVNSPRDEGPLHLRPFSLNGFRDDLATCHGVICGAGFELTSEAIHLGKKLLVKPVAGQMEQLSNALALERLGLATRMNRLAPGTVTAWLQAPATRRMVFPDTASELAHWITQGCTESIEALSRRLWARTNPQGAFRSPWQGSGTPTAPPSLLTEHRLRPSLPIPPALRRPPFTLS
ncbi:MJ1255/VC2487 family glycosyltransferase [Desulfoluna spongiiphila]|uniref:MJ1255/VC2487 family glycosyltransferase n=1 Tax=Desulfoluna spongiiphila TaxID=419481 RepID=UPI00125816F2|nr:MJ1255/VC2487 family glycosyltransferase [Desulfoluna spongiiphila]VVS93888.1 consensus disorder prediction [Desulfoluna spongiiphila]